MSRKFHQRLWFLVRAHQWWHFKLPLTVLAALLLISCYPCNFTQAGCSILLLLFCGLAAGSYASVLNDFADLKQDAAAGKTTPLMQLSKTKRLAVLGAVIVLCSGTLFLLQPYPLSTLIFAGVLFIHAAYDLAPLRLKERGPLGLLAISLGEHLLPSLLALAITAESFTPARTIPLPMVFALSIWALAFGLRGIVWHQLCDRDNDIRSSCRTLATKLSSATLINFGRRILLPLELIALAWLLILNNNALATAVLAIYLLSELYMTCFTMKGPIIAEPVPNGRFLLFDFYRIYWPLALLITMAGRQQGYWLITAGFLLCFSEPLQLQWKNQLNIWRYKIIPRWRSLNPPPKGPVLADFESLYKKTDDTLPQTQSKHDEPKINAQELWHAISKAVSFLETNQLPSGGFRSWLVPHISTGLDPVADSSPFPAALIAHCLSRTELPEAKKMHARAVHFLSQQMEAGGAWRYFASDHPRHLDSPLDLDDTSTAASILQRSGVSIESSKKVALANRNYEGLFYTWVIPRPALLFNDATFNIAWRELQHKPRLQSFFLLNEAEPNDIDAVVNANVLYMLGPGKETKPVVKFLTKVVKAEQEESTDKWHHSRFNLYYAMAKSMSEDQKLFQSIRPTIVNRIRENSDATGLIGKHLLDTALAISTLIELDKNNRIIEPALQILLDNQMQSGAWPSLPLYWGGPSQGCSFQSTEITTAFCLEALCRYAAGQGLEAPLTNACRPQLAPNVQSANTSANRA